MAAELKVKPNCALHIKCNTVTAQSQCAGKHCISVRSVRIAFAVSQILVNALFIYLRVCIFVRHIHTLKSEKKIIFGKCRD
jgi:hypothetical protein